MIEESFFFCLKKGRGKRSRKDSLQSSQVFFISSLSIEKSSLKMDFSFGFHITNTYEKF